MSSWSFQAWSEGTMVRYGAYFFVNVLISLYCFWFVLNIFSIISRLNVLRGFLFLGDVDPTLLDSRVTYECSPSPAYSLSSKPEDQDALTFYQNKWSPSVFQKTLDYSLEFVCLSEKFYLFGDYASRGFTIFYTLVLFTFFLQLFRCLRERVPLSKIFCSEAKVFDFFLSSLVVFFVIELLPTLYA